MMVHYSPISAPIDTLLALATGQAFRLGIHQESSQLSHSTTMGARTSIEMRRRLWWHIMTLDIQCAAYNKKSPMVSDAMWNTKFPGTFNDNELTMSNSSIPPPTSQIFDADTVMMGSSNSHGEDLENRRADNSFSLSRIEIIYALSVIERLATSSRFTERVKYTDELVQKLNKKYLQLWTGNDTQSFFERNALKLMLSKLLLSAKGDVPTQEILQQCAVVAEAAASLRMTYPSCAWLLRQSVELENLELLWKCLATLPENMSANPPYVWALAESATKSGERDDMAACYPHQWERIIELRDRAMQVRATRRPGGSRADAVVVE
ncbi:hypothetical protein BT63DRAFT_428381 [Microthyrium microscopicum]|uniref:Xylanolytic transcriptional activator regulatory domain-containing protein n=1 Tax=Microthyrium microscopicum TaxID=703497 RepID=A0A6A6U2Q5_9PEZI|nr:hypothetical protein BT63DRAFT_428381 [Microthyrium microscopicum]